MAKRKRRGRKRRRTGTAPKSKQRLAHMSLGCLVLLVLLAAFLLVPRVLQGISIF